MQIHSLYPVRLNSLGWSDNCGRRHGRVNRVGLPLEKLYGRLIHQIKKQALNARINDQHERRHQLDTSCYPEAYSAHSCMEWLWHNFCNIWSWKDVSHENVEPGTWSTYLVHHSKWSRRSCWWSWICWTPTVLPALWWNLDGYTDIIALCKVYDNDGKVKQGCATMIATNGACSTLP